MIIRDYQSLYVPLDRARALLKNCHDEELYW